MVRHERAFGNAVACLSVLFLTLCVSLCVPEAAFCQQKVMTSQSTAKPSSDGPPQKVEAVQAYKNQMQSCEAKRQELAKENDALQKQNKDLQQQKADLQKKLDEFTRIGGSSVKAYCKSGTVSANTAGATNDCGSIGYMCEPVSGLCRTGCTVTTQCASGFVCDWGVSWKCVRRQ